MSELQGLGAKLSEAERAGVEIVAVSPDPNEHSQKLAEGLRLGFRFVADRDLAVARRYGLVHGGGGPEGQDVPRPATVVLDRNGVVRWFSVSRNFQVRPDLDDERRARRMRLDVITRRATDDRDVRLRLGPTVQDDRTLCLDEPAPSERPLQRLRHEKHRRPVPARLRLLHEQQPIEQLDRVVLVEEAAVDQPRVLVAGPPAQAGPLSVLHTSQGRRRETGMLDPGAACGVTWAEASNTSRRS